MKLTADLKKRMKEIDAANWKGVYPEAELLKDPEQKLAERICEFTNILREISPMLKLGGKRILDLGSGFGYLELAFESRTAEIIGLEPDADEVAVARELLKGHGSCHFVCAVGESMPFGENSFDRILSFSVLEHVASLEKVLHECYRVLKPGGLFFLGVPNFFSFRESHYKVFFLPLMNRTLAKWYLRCLGRKPEFLDTLNYVTPSRMREKVKAAGFEIIEDAVDFANQRFEAKMTAQNLQGWMRLAVPLIRVLHLRGLCRYLFGIGFFITNRFIVRKPDTALTP